MGDSGSSAADTLAADLLEMDRCLKRESEVLYARHYFAGLFEDAFRRVDKNLKGEAAASRLILPDRQELVQYLKAKFLKQS